MSNVLQQKLTEASHTIAFTNTRHIVFRLLALRRKSFMMEDRRATVAFPIAVPSIFITEIFHQLPRK